MNKGIEKALKTVGEQVQAVGKSIASGNLTAKELKQLSHALRSHSKTLEIYSIMSKK